ncbi:hypothetical protein ACNSPG_06555 [Brucella pituitosa]|uniref:hypothetical protein n=1 Tax=Brucella pituitosa TaxID=571256 RepID=UPI003C75160F
MLRFARDGKPKPVMGEGGAPIVYPTKLEATEEALKHLLAYMNSDYLRVGETASSKVTEAEKVFGTIFKKGRKIEVERKRAAA